MKLKIENWRVYLQGQEILHDLDIEIEQGLLVSLLGASGCGKTTLLKSIAGLLPAEQGRIRLNGKEIGQCPPEKRGTVIVFQDLRLFPHMNVEQNIGFAMDIQRKSRAEKREVTRQLLAEVQLSGYEKRKIRELSGGQMQRVALARALAADPQVLLLDEPFSGLDEGLRQTMGQLVRMLQKKKQITTILVTHDKKEAMQMSDRLALMKEGRILQYDKPEILYEQPANRETAEYFGSVNRFSGTIENGVFSCPYFSCPLSERYMHLRDGRYEAFVRPAGICQTTDDDRLLVRETRFLGEIQEAEIEAADGSGLRILAADTEHSWRCGQRVGIRVNERKVMYFEERNI